MTEQEIEGILDKTMVFFRFLQEKDVFEKYYEQQNEFGLFRLSVAASSHKKLKGMLKDITVSNTIMEEFKENTLGCGVSKI